MHRRILILLFLTPAYDFYFENKNSNCFMVNWRDYAGIMVDVRHSKLCRHNVSTPNYHLVQSRNNWHV